MMQQPIRLYKLRWPFSLCVYLQCTQLAAEPEFQGIEPFLFRCPLIRQQGFQDLPGAFRVQRPFGFVWYGQHEFDES